MKSLEFESVPFAPGGEFEFEDGEGNEAEAWESERPRGRNPARGGATPRLGAPTSGSKPRSRPVSRPRPKPHVRGVRRRASRVVVAPAPPCVCPVHGTEYVRWVQSALNQVESSNLTVNGVMSTATRNALRKFQSSKGLPVDGIAGPEVEQALRDARGSGKGAAAPADGPASDQGELYEAGEAYVFETLEFEAPTARAPQRRGSRGAAVTDLQHRLGSAGVSAGAADGILGSNTDAAQCKPWLKASVGSQVANLDEVDELEEEVGFDSPTRTPRPVRAAFVSCNKPSAAFTVITGPDPVGTIGRANTRAIALLDRAINALQNPRERIRRGAAAAAPTVSAQVSSALRGRFGLDASVRSLWTGTGARSVLVLIRRLRGARQILADGWMKYTCLGASSVKLGDCAGPGCPPDDPVRRAVSCGGHSRIVLCTAWWSDSTADQATTLLHECFHIYFGFIRDSGNFGNAHCYEHFVLNLNGLQPQAGFEGQCP